MANKCPIFPSFQSLPRLEKILKQTYISVRETGVSRRHEDPIKTAPVTPQISYHYGTEEFKGGSLIGPPKFLEMKLFPAGIP